MNSPFFGASTPAASAFRRRGGRRLSALTPRRRERITPPARYPMRQLASAQAICFGDGVGAPSKPKQIELPHRPPAPKTSLLRRAGSGGRRNCELFVLCRLRTPCCQFRVPVVLEKIQRRQALPWSRCPTEHGVRRRSNAAAGVFGLRRGGGRGRVGVCRVVRADRPARNVRGTSRVAPAGGSPARSVRRRSREGRGGLRVGWWSSGCRPCLRAGITAPAWACTRNKNGVGAAVVLASGGYGWDKDRNRNWRCTATGCIAAGGGGSGPATLTAAPAGLLCAPRR